jgi:hypothetical protein
MHLEAEAKAVYVESEAWCVSPCYFPLFLLFLYLVRMSWVHLERETGTRDTHRNTCLDHAEPVHITPGTHASS